MLRAANLDRFIQLLIDGRRGPCKELLDAELSLAPNAEHVYHTLLWPAMEKIFSLYRQDRINTAREHAAIRICRVLVDQLQASLVRRPPNGKLVLITCGDGEPEELGAQMCADLLEAHGWEVYFVGGGIPSDEILGLVGQLNPTLLLIFGTQPQGVPGVRQLIDLLREVGVNPTMNVMIAGGVFNRADGLWEEVKADLFAPTAKHVLAVAEKAAPRTPEIRVPGAPKKRRRRRPGLATEAPRGKQVLSMSEASSI